jgi:DNA-binding transcriptional ArsR family regulator
MPRRNTHAATLPAEAIELVAARFRLLGDATRIRILQELLAGERTVSEVLAAVGSTQPNVSKHLRLLQAAGVVDRRAQGGNAYYYLADDSIAELCTLVCSSLRQRVESAARQLGLRR